MESMCNIQRTKSNQRTFTDLPHRLLLISLVLYVLSIGTNGCKLMHSDRDRNEYL